MDTVCIEFVQYDKGLKRAKVTGREIRDLSCDLSYLSSKCLHINMGNTVIIYETYLYTNQVSFFRIVSPSIF